MLDLFHVQTDFKGFTCGGRDKPREADGPECIAYARWLARRAGIDDDGVCELHYRTIGRGASSYRVCVGATFSARNDLRYELGGTSVLFPGANQRAVVTLETLDDAGSVIASSTLPVEPRKGGVVWKAAEVRAISGKVPKVKARPTEKDSTSGLVKVRPGAITPVNDTSADVLARLAALEAAIAALPAQSVASPTVEIRPRRSHAHERAVRRAWTERRHRRLAMAIAEDHRRMRNVAQEAQAKFERAREAAWSLADKRDGTVARARRMLNAARKRADTKDQRIAALEAQAESAATAAREALSEATGARQGQQAARAELARLRADMVDPSQPERASDLMQLRRERDEAQTACAALQQRCERAEAARDTLADAVEGMASRMAVAEAAVRRLQAA